MKRSKKMNFLIVLHSGNIGSRNPTWSTLYVPRDSSLRIPRTSRNRKRGLFRRFLLNHSLVVVVLCYTQENYGSDGRPSIRLLNLATRCSFIARPWRNISGVKLKRWIRSSFARPITMCVKRERYRRDERYEPSNAERRRRRETRSSILVLGNKGKEMETF